MKVILSGNIFLWYQKWQNAILLGLLTIGTYGVPIYTFSVILNSMRDIEGWSVSTLAGIYASSLLVAGGIAPFAGRFLDNRSPRIILASGLCPLLLGCFFPHCSCLEERLTLAGHFTRLYRLLMDPLVLTF